MHEQFRETDVMEFVADHAEGLIEMLRKSEDRSEVYVITYLLAAIRDEALSALNGNYVTVAPPSHDEAAISSS